MFFKHISYKIKLKNKCIVIEIDLKLNSNPVSIFPVHDDSFYDVI